MNLKSQVGFKFFKETLIVAYLMSNHQIQRLTPWIFIDSCIDLRFLAEHCWGFNYINPKLQIGKRYWAL